MKVYVINVLKGNKMEIDYDIETENMANRLSKKIFNEKLKNQPDNIKGILRKLAFQMVNNNVCIEDIEKDDKDTK